MKVFVGTSANALKTQIWTALIAMLMILRSNGRAIRCYKKVTPEMRYRRSHYTRRSLIFLISFRSNLGRRS